MAKRLQAISQPNYANGFKVVLHEQVLETSLTWKKPQIVFVNAMSDLFHRDGGNISSTAYTIAKNQGHGSSIQKNGFHTTPDTYKTWVDFALARESIYIPDI